MMQDTTRFTADRQAYVQSHVTLAAVAMALAMLILWLIGSPHVWTGAVAGLAAVAFRGWFLASEALAETWELDGDTLTGPGGRRVPFDQIETLRSMGRFVQIITKGGDKHLIKYQADPAATIATIERHRR
ncbi:hypothetical protein QO034_03875 [Sedimentitalea sp. JM2-8]|uniref:PH domain-containing protein n=1 Tax=Sedimentitalea xiamensis TaxID=3050037 RepID=A0ABT7FBL8_9RHOB|nr:hypothetical protein [Sedimentitalea xiamensis]MDK3072239.1 hypothetical protein [Sedimentitalea xiamensis]